jgi:hypothetical protein
LDFDLIGIFKKIMINIRKKTLNGSLMNKVTPCDVITASFAKKVPRQGAHELTK